ncbi:hypothetical protein GALL_316550 [mine drainage metagenome]|uniref:Transposase IS4-like domain-containing protein n=1 Tax=mine drainage metagenome TaxID=410659 RepID=A0A1J5R366_9ZZZZ
MSPSSVVATFVGLRATARPRLLELFGQVSDSRTSTRRPDSKWPVRGARARPRPAGWCPRCRRAAARRHAGSADGHQRRLLAGRRVIGVDGTTVRGARVGERGAPHLAVALDHTEGFALGQVPVDAKSHGIPDLRTVREGFDLVGDVVTADSTGTRATTQRRPTHRTAPHVLTHDFAESLTSPRATSHVTKPQVTCPPTRRCRDPDQVPLWSSSGCLQVRSICSKHDIAFTARSQNRICVGSASGAVEQHGRRLPCFRAVARTYA